MNFINVFEKLTTDSSASASGRWSRTDSLQAVEAEIRREKAEALGRAGERLEQALRDLESVRRAIVRIEDRRLDSHNTSEEASSFQRAHADLTARQAVLRAHARVMFEYLLIQREAVGIRNHLDVERCYRISERLG